MIESVNYLKISFCGMNPLAGGSYMELPKFIKDKKACINVKNDDDRCFEWAVLSALFPAEKDGQKISKYKKHKDYLKFDRINFPMQLKDIPKS